MYQFLIASMSITDHRTVPATFFYFKNVLVFKFVFVDYSGGATAFSCTFLLMEWAAVKLYSGEIRSLIETHNFSILNDGVLHSD